MGISFGEYITYSLVLFIVVKVIKKPVFWLVIGKNVEKWEKLYKTER